VNDREPMSNRPGTFPSIIAPLVFAANGPALFDGVARIAVVGGESTGKSTLVNALGAHYGEPCVAEYGRTLWEQQGGHTDYDDLRTIGLRHVADEDAAMRVAKRCVFIDTTPLTTLWYSIDGYGCADPELVELSWRPYDLTLVCAPDFAFVQDGSRSSEDFRLRHDRWIRSILRARGADYIDVRGSVEARVAQVAALIDPLFDAS
jgi:HTH-type transcriptional regulator, transcriptional repressor of NAD biosynthesis genes